MSNKLPKTIPHQHQPDLQSAAMQHQLHLQTVDVLTKLYEVSTKDSDHSHPMHLALKDALQNLMEPFQPTKHATLTPPSPVIQ